MAISTCGIESEVQIGKKPREKKKRTFWGPKKNPFCGKQQNITRGGLLLNAQKEPGGEKNENKKNGGGGKVSTTGPADRKKGRGILKRGGIEQREERGREGFFLVKNFLERGGSPIREHSYSVDRAALPKLGSKGRRNRQKGGEDWGGTQHSPSI